MYVTAIFRSRSASIDFAGRLTDRGIANSLINTPKSANVGCGLSVKFPERNLYTAKQIIARVGYPSFVGFFRYGSKKSGMYPTA